MRLVLYNFSFPQLIPGVFIDAGKKTSDAYKNGHLVVTAFEITANERMERRLLDLCMLPSVQIVRHQASNNSSRYSDECLISNGDRNRPARSNTVHEELMRLCMTVRRDDRFDEE